MSIIKPALKNEYKKPDLATQVIIDAKNLLRDRLRMGGYKLSHGLEEVLVAAFTKPEFGDIIYSTSDCQAGRMESLLAFVLPTLLQKQSKAIIFSPSFLQQPPMKEALNELNLDSAIYNHRTDFDVREEQKNVFKDPESKLNFFHATPEMYTKENQWLTEFLDEVTRLRKVDFVVVTHAEWILDDFKQFRDFEKLQGLKDSNRSLKWIVLGTNVARNDAKRVAFTFGLRNPHFINDEGESTILMQKVFYYDYPRTIYFDKEKYMEDNESEEESEEESD